MSMSGLSPTRQLLFYLKGYKVPLFLNILCNILMALCMVISIPIIIPFFQILFGRVTPSAKPVPFSLNNIQEWLEFIFGQLVKNYSQEGALVIVCKLCLDLLVKKYFQVSVSRVYGAGAKRNCAGCT